MLSYPPGLPVSTRALSLLAQAPQDHREQIYSPWRRLSPGRQALLVLAHLRRGARYADLAAGFGIGLATVHRYVHKALAVLAVLTPTLQQATTVAASKAHVILDGTLLRIDHVATTVNGPPKAQAYGVNVQTLTDPAGRLIWASPALPGSRHDIACAREHGSLTALTGAGVLALGNRDSKTPPVSVLVFGCRSAHAAKTTPTASSVPSRPNQRAVNLAHAQFRAPGERGNAQLKNWRVLRKIRSSPSHANELVAAVQTLILAS